MAVHEGGFLSLFTRQSGRQRVLPSQDSDSSASMYYTECKPKREKKKKTEKEGLGTRLLHSLAAVMPNLSTVLPKGTQYR